MLVLAGVASAFALAAGADAGEQAARTTGDDARWQAIAHYRAGDFARAAAALESFDDADSLYNRGIALAKLGRYADALGLFDAALASRPGDADFRHNRDLVAKLLPPQEMPPPAGRSPPPPAAPARARQEEKEAQRVAEQWLRRVPDMPPPEAGDADSLLQRKLAFEARRRAAAAGSVTGEPRGRLR
jgi:Ca-activated chloride channel family protein